MTPSIFHSVFRRIIKLNRLSMHRDLNVADTLFCIIIISLWYACEMISRFDIVLHINKRINFRNWLGIFSWRMNIYILIRNRLSYQVFHTAVWIILRNTWSENSCKWRHYSPATQLIQKIPLEVKMTWS